MGAQIGTIANYHDFTFVLWPIWLRIGARMGRGWLTNFQSNRSKNEWEIMIICNGFNLWPPFERVELSFDGKWKSFCLLGQWKVSLEYQTLVFSLFEEFYCVEKVEHFAVLHLFFSFSIYHVAEYKATFMGRFWISHFNGIIFLAWMHNNEIECENITTHHAGWNFEQTKNVDCLNLSS